MTGTRRLEAVFARCAAEGRSALLTYVMAGDPDPAESELLAAACIDGGADIVELGIPFSDPLADGPVIQAAGERALASGTRLADVLRVAGSLRERTATPLVLMGYLNPILAMGEEAFFAACQDRGVDAVIIPDLLPESAGVATAAAGRSGTGLVFMVATATSPARRRRAAEVATAFVYLTAVDGVTGVRAQLPEHLAADVAVLKADSRVPVVVGFGISRPSHVAALNGVADGVVVGSAIVAAIGRESGTSRRVRAVRTLVAALRGAMAT
ncbi:MAG: tryptophan synthase subunit alpha [Acidimicrobiales bacterium]|jgi:tryptophan synthase alpha chain